MTTSASQVARLQGPILVLGADGFLGTNLIRRLLSERDDVFGTVTQPTRWTLEGVSPERLRSTDLHDDRALEALLEEVRPRTIFHCLADTLGTSDDAEMYAANFALPTRLLPRLLARRIAAYVQAGRPAMVSAPERGEDAAVPDTMYAVAEGAAAGLLQFYGRRHGLPCALVRPAAAYGPWQEASHPVSQLVAGAVEGQGADLPNLDLSTDFVYIGDVCEALIAAALDLSPDSYGTSHFVGSGQRIDLREVATLLAQRPALSVSGANGGATFSGKTPLEAGLTSTVVWYQGLADKEAYRRESEISSLDSQWSISAVVACYRESQTIPHMYERLKATFVKLGVDHEIIFVNNDNSPQDDQETVRALSEQDPHVVGLSLSRNFGSSQPAFRAGMEIATKNSCVLIDGDLQDPPEMIADFVEKWKEGYEVIYGVRVKREAPLHMQFLYKAFYRVFDKFSNVTMPNDAGDFALMDRRVVQWMLNFPERDLFLRGIRAFVGFRQTGIEYVRSERMFGRSNYSLLKNFHWAKMGILSFSNAPLGMLTYFGTILLLLSIVLALVQIVARLLFPHLTPQGLTTVLLSIFFFGSVNLFALSLIGEYVAKIIEEVKRRPYVIPRNIIRRGRVLPVQPTGTRLD